MLAHPSLARMDAMGVLAYPPYWHTVPVSYARAVLLVLWQGADAAAPMADETQ